MTRAMNMNRFAWRAALMGFFLAAAAPAHSESIPAVADSLFKWGEYDSLGQIVRHWLAGRNGGRNGADAHSLAKANLFLGVAYYSAGQMDSANLAFARACKLEPGIQPDRFYLSPEVAFRFESIAEEERKRSRNERSQTASANSPGPSNRRGKSWPWIGWTAGGLGIAAVGIFVYVTASRKPEATPETVTIIKVD